MCRDPPEQVCRPPHHPPPLFLLRETSIGQILAIMRQWVPQTQHNMDKLIMEVAKQCQRLMLIAR
jgi:hypothetical protein